EADPTQLELAQEAPRPAAALAAVAVADGILQLLAPFCDPCRRFHRASRLPSRAGTACRGASADFSTPRPSRPSSRSSRSFRGPCPPWSISLQERPAGL